MIGTFHHMANTAFLFLPRPGLIIHGTAGACAKFETPPGKGLIIMVTPLDPANILVILEAWPESEHISIIQHPQPSPFGACWDVKHSLTPVNKVGSPTEYETVEEVALVGTDGTDLVIHDVATPGPITDYVKTHAAYEPVDLHDRALRTYVAAGVEAAIISCPFQFGVDHIVNLFTAGVSFAHLYPNIVKWAMKQEPPRLFPVWSGNQGFLKEKLDTLETVLKEHADEWEGKRVEGAPGPESVDVPEHLRHQLTDLLRDIHQGEGEDGPVL